MEIFFALAARTAQVETATCASQAIGCIVTAPRQTELHCNMTHSLLDRFGNITIGYTAKAHPMEASSARLDPDDIIAYTMFHEKVDCACGSTTRSSRLWIQYREGRGTNSRPMGKSETIYANIQVKELYKDLATPACPLCIDSVKREKWEKRKVTLVDPRNSNFTASSPAKPASTPKASAVSLDDLMAKMK